MALTLTPDPHPNLNPPNQVTNDPADLPAPPGSPPPSPPPAPPGGSDCSDSEEDEAVDPDARNGLSARSKSGAMTPQERNRQRDDQRAKKARGEASRSRAMLPNKRSKPDALAPPSRDESISGTDGSEADAVEGKAGAAVGEAAVGDGEAVGGEADAAVGEAEVDVGEEEEADEREEEAEAAEGEGEGPKYSAETRKVLDEHKERKSKLVGLADAKKTADNILFSAIGQGIGTILEDNESNYNCIVVGESGVGKTTIVKELLYKPLKGLGVLTGEFVVMSPRQLQAKGALEAALEDADGGMLFIDEAYGLRSSNATTTQLVGLLPPSGGDVMVVAAGYRGKVMGWLGTNEGLPARFPTIIDIPPPTADELKSIGVGVVQEQGFAELGVEELDVLCEATEHIKALPPSEAKVPRNANAIRRIVGKEGAMKHFYAEMGRRGGGRVSDNDKVLTKAHIEAGLASFKEYVASVMAGSSGGGSSGAAGSSSATVVRATPLEHNVVLSIARARMPPERSLTPMWQVLSDAAGAKVVLELQDTFKPDPENIVVMRRKTPHEDTTIMSALSDASLLRLAQGSKDPENEVKCARNHKCNSHTWSTIHRNLKWCLDKAFPGCTIEINTTGKTLVTYKAFKGEYVVGLAR